jgi:hypothetical protein
MGFLERFGERWERTGEMIAKLPPPPERRRPRNHSHAAPPAQAAPPVGDDASSTDNGPGSASLMDELDECKRVVADLTEVVELHKARADAFAAVLRLGGVKLMLTRGFHPEQHPNAPESDKLKFNEAMAQINVAYDLLEEDNA